MPPCKSRPCFVGLALNIASRLGWRAKFESDSVVFAEFFFNQIKRKELLIGGGEMQF